jgi:hypothetical protein
MQESPRPLFPAFLHVRESALLTDSQTTADLQNRDGLLIAPSTSTQLVPVVGCADGDVTSLFRAA